METQSTLFTPQNIDEQIDELSQDQESSSLNARTIHDLYQLYDHTTYSSQLEHSLERIEQRLTTPGTQHEAIGAGKQQSSPEQVQVTIGYRQTRQQRRTVAHSPLRSFASLLASLAAVILVVLLVGSLALTLLAIRHNGSDTGGKSEPATVTVHPEPAIVTVNLEAESFHPSSITIKQGQRILLVNDTDVAHFIMNGYWKSDSTFVELREPGMPRSPLDFGVAHQTHLIGPLNTPGIYHLFDKIHASMSLTITVQTSGSTVDATPMSAINAARVYMEEQVFSTNIIIIRKGTSLLLINDTPTMHVITNGYWKGNNLVLLSEPGTPKIRIVFQTDQQSKLIGPFNTAGNFHLVDTVHAGMNLTIIVK